MTAIARIALLIGEDLSFGRRILQGIYHFARPGHAWVFRIGLPTPSNIRPLAEWHPAGVIVLLHHRDMLADLLALGKPVVNVSALHPDIMLPRVANDDFATGVLAAQYFLARGYTHFAYCGHRAHGESSLRETGFRAGVQQQGGSVSSFQYTSALPFQYSESWIDEDLAVRQWVRALPKPVGVLVYNDLGALRFSEVCLHAGVRVPEDVAILGVDNDELKCQLASPPLASIDLAAERIGYDAASLLDKLMAGVPPPRQPALIDPLRLVSRHSADALAVPDAEVEHALRFITAHAHEPITVAELLHAVPLGRRTLEKRFQQLLQRTPLQEIHRQRCEHIKGLLVHTGDDIAGIAAALGFRSPQHLSALFKLHTGLTPRDYRRHYRVGQG